MSLIDLNAQIKSELTAQEYIARRSALLARAAQIDKTDERLRRGYKRKTKTKREKLLKDVNKGSRYKRKQGKIVKNARNNKREKYREAREALPEVVAEHNKLFFTYLVDFLKA